MSLNNEILTSDQVHEQIKALHHKKDELLLKMSLAVERLKKIETVMAENETLAQKQAVLMNESIDLLLEEWKKSQELYPEVRLNILTKTAQLLAPADKAPPPSAT